MFLPRPLYELIPVVYFILGCVGVFFDIPHLGKVYGVILISSSVYFIRLRAIYRRWKWW